MSRSGDVQHYKYDLTNRCSRPWTRALVICEAEWNWIRKLPVWGSMQWKRFQHTKKKKHQGGRRKLLSIVATKAMRVMLGVFCSDIKKKRKKKR